MHYVLINYVSQARLQRLRVHTIQRLEIIGQHLCVPFFIFTFSTQHRTLGLGKKGGTQLEQRNILNELFGEAAM